MTGASINDDGSTTQSFGAVESGVALLLGVTAVLIAGVAPVILGGLVHETRLTVSQIGLTAMAEGLAMAGSTALAAALLRPVRLRLIAAAAAFVHAFGTFATIWGTGLEIILCRTVTGLASGILLWITIGMITRSTQPGRWSGVFLTLQTLAQFGFAAVLPVWVAPSFGVNGMLVCLAGFSALAMTAALAGPRAYQELVKTDVGHSALGGRALVGLFAVLAQLAFLTAVWVYFEALGVQSGLTPKVAGLVVAITLASQVVGGAVATWVGKRLAAIVVFAVASLLNLALLATLATEPPTGLFIACAVMFGFLWLFVLPFQTQFLIDVDPSRRAAMQVATAQILGSSAGPLAAALLVSDKDVRAALAFGAACIGVGLAAAVFALFSGRRQIAALAFDRST